MKILQEANLQHFVEYTLQGNYSDNGIYTISKLNITHVKIMALTEWLYSRLVPENNLRNPVIYRTFEALPLHQRKIIGASMLITRYCIYRLLTLFKIYQGSAWTYREVNDYYGTEIEVVMVNQKLAETIDWYLTALRGKDDQKKIEYILLTEYGRLLPSITNKKWFVGEVDYRELEFSNPVHLDRCLQGYFKKILVKHVPQYTYEAHNAVHNVQVPYTPGPRSAIHETSDPVDQPGDQPDEDQYTEEATTLAEAQACARQAGAEAGAEAEAEAEAVSLEGVAQPEVVSLEGVAQPEAVSLEGVAQPEAVSLEGVPVDSAPTTPKAPVGAGAGAGAGADASAGAEPNPHVPQCQVPTQSHYECEYVPNIPRYLEEYSLPLGLVIQKGDRYKVIDGYHRIASHIASNPQAKFMVIYCLE